MESSYWSIMVKMQYEINRFPWIFISIHVPTPTHWSTLHQGRSRCPERAPWMPCARALPCAVFIDCKYSMACFTHSCWQTQGLSAVIHNEPRASLVLAFLLCSVLFFIPNLINLHSPWGAAADSSLPIRQTHLCCFDFGCSISLWFVYICVIQKNTGARWTGKYFSIGTAINLFVLQSSFKHASF